MKKIGFVDFYISEWHANNYPAWINEKCKELGLDYTVAYAWAEQYDSPVDNRNTDEWCKDFGVTRCETLEELCEKSDVILVLSPSNPEKHLGYAKTVLKYGKRTYIDKTFAPNIDHAQKIFDIAKEYNTPFFSSSALRYSTELDGIDNVTEAVIYGNGGSVNEYIVHEIEMLVKKLGIGATAVKAETVGAEKYFFIKYDDGRSGMLNYGDYDFAFLLKNGKDKLKMRIKSDFFKGLMADILRFYETGKTSFDINETLEVIKIRDAVLKAEENLGKEIKV